jgi:DNA-binding PadR family transcriptional regulator
MSEKTHGPNNDGVTSANDDAQFETDDYEHASDLTQFQLNICAVLADGADYGLGIKDDLEQYYDAEVGNGRLYPNLDELVERGLVAKSTRDQRTNEYALTDDGAHLVRERAQWLVGKLDLDVIGGKAIESDPLTTTVEAGGLDDD